MTIPHMLFLLFAAALVAAESFTLTAYAPAARAIHGKHINASGRRFLIGLDTPSSYCPQIPKIECPPGTSTTVGEDLTYLSVMTPGGQAVYVAPDGTVSYTAAHTSYTPPGSIVKGFFEKMVVSTCSAEQTRLLDFCSLDGTAKGVYACPNPDLAETWLLVAAGRKSRASNGDCVLLEGLELRSSPVEFGAWQY